MKKNTERFSLIKRNSKIQFEVAIVLISIIPSLVLFHVGSINRWWGNASLYSITLLALGSLIPVLLGYIIIGFYPATIIKIRRYMESIAKEELPEEIDLIRQEDDINAIETAMNMVLEKQKKIAALERQRVMMESLGAACHHIGQPMTVINTYLAMMKRSEKSEEKLEMIKECAKASESVSDILNRFRGINEYKTVPYCYSPDRGPNGPHERIVKV